MAILDLEALLDEPEVLAGERVFATAQTLLGENKVGVQRYSTKQISWYGTAADPRPEFQLRGCFGMVQAGGSLQDLVGDIIRVNFDTRSVLVYVLASFAAPFELMITRRSWLAIEQLSTRSISVDVDLMQ